MFLQPRDGRVRNFLTPGSHVAPNIVGKHGMAPAVNVELSYQHDEGSKEIAWRPGGMLWTTHHRHLSNEEP